MAFKKFNFVDKEDFYKPLLIFVIFPYVFFKSFVFPLEKSVDGLMAVSILIMIVFYIFCYFYFLKPSFISHIELRADEIRFFKPFSNRWAPIDSYRYIANDNEFKKVLVYKQNCEKIGKIGLKSAKAEEKKEFLAKIEPWLVIRGEDSAYLSKDLVKSSD